MIWLFLGVVTCLLWHWPHFFLPTPPHLFTYSIHSRGNGGKEGRSLHEFSAALSLPMGIIRFLLRRKSMMDVMQGVPIGLRFVFYSFLKSCKTTLHLMFPTFLLFQTKCILLRSISPRSSMNGYVYVILNAWKMICSELRYAWNCSHFRRVIDVLSFRARAQFLLAY